MRRIGLIVFPKFEVSSLSAAAVFEIANLVAKVDLYELRVLSEAGGAVQSSIGMAVDTEAFDETAFDTVIVAGSLLLEQPSSARLVAYVRNVQKKCRRVGSVCAGTRILAEAGLLDGRRVAAHGFYADHLQARFAKIKVEDDRVFISDGPIWTSAGIAGCIDVAIAMLQEDHGTEMARSVAQHLVLRDSGDQFRYSASQGLDPKTDRIHSALVYARNNLHTPLSVKDLAEAACLSPRQFRRVFRAKMGASPAKVIEKLRVEAARLMLKQSQHSIGAIACLTGFGERRRMRRAFQRLVGWPPPERRKKLSSVTRWDWSRGQLDQFRYVPVGNIIDIPKPAEAAADPKIQKVDDLE